MRKTPIIRIDSIIDAVDVLEQNIRLSDASLTKEMKKFTGWDTIGHVLGELEYFKELIKEYKETRNERY